MLGALPAVQRVGSSDGMVTLESTDTDAALKAQYQPRRILRAGCWSRETLSTAARSDSACTRKRDGPWEAWDNLGMSCLSAELGGRMMQVGKRL